MTLFSQTIQETLELIRLIPLLVNLHRPLIEWDWGYLSLGGGSCQSGGDWYTDTSCLFLFSTSYWMSVCQYIHNNQDIDLVILEVQKLTTRPL